MNTFLRLFESRSNGAFNSNLPRDLFFLPSMTDFDLDLYGAVISPGSTVGNQGCHWDTMGKDFPYRSMTFEPKTSEHKAFGVRYRQGLFQVVFCRVFIPEGCFIPGI